MMAGGGGGVEDPCFKGYTVLDVEACTATKKGGRYSFLLTNKEIHLVAKMGEWSCAFVACH